MLAILPGVASSQSQRDPFVPLVSESGMVLIPQELDITGLNLRGIIYAGKESVAIVNDQVLKVGDAVGEYVIAEIRRKEVVLEKQDASEQFTLKLEEE